MFSEEDFTTFLIFILVLILTYVCFRKPVGIPPGPVLTVPILGDLTQFAFERGDVIGTLRRLRKVHGKIYSFYMGRELAIVVNGYNMIHTVAAKRGAQFCGRPQTYTNAIISKGKGLALASGNQWKHQRHFASKAFLKLGMKKKSYEKHIICEVKALTGEIEKQNGQPVDLKQYVYESTENVVFTSIIGKRDQNHSLRQNFIHLVETEARLLLKISALLSCFPFLKYMPKDPLYVHTLQIKSLKCFSKKELFYQS